MAGATGLNAENWINQYADGLFRFALHRVNDRGFAEDIVQETFLSAWKSRESYNSTSSEKNWLYAICNNKIIDHFRRKSTTLTQYVDVTGHDPIFDGAGHWTKATAPKDWGATMLDGKLESNEFSAYLVDCRKKLQATQDMVFTLKYIADMSSETICKVLGITSSNYWVLVHRAKLNLRKCLEANWVEK